MHIDDLISGLSLGLIGLCIAGLFLLCGLALLVGAVACLVLVLG